MILEQPTPYKHTTLSTHEINEQITTVPAGICQQLEMLMKVYRSKSNDEHVALL